MSDKFDEEVSITLSVRDWHAVTTFVRFGADSIAESYVKLPRAEQKALQGPMASALSAQVAIAIALEPYAAKVGHSEGGKR